MRKAWSVVLIAVTAALAPLAVGLPSSLIAGAATTASVRWYLPDFGGTPGFTAIKGTNVGVAPDGTIYYTDGASLVAINGDGTTRWRSAAVPAWTQNELGNPTVGGDGTIFATGSHFLFAFAPDGSLRWSFATAGPSDGAVSASDGTVYVLSGFNTGGGNFGTSRLQVLQAVNPDGTERWQHVLLSGSGTGMGGFSGLVRPAVAGDGTVYVGTWDGTFFALNPDGTEKWHLLTGASLVPNAPDPRAAVTGSAAVGADGSAYFPSGGDLWAVSSTGAVLWRAPVGSLTGQESLSWPTVGIDGTIHTGSTDGHFYAISPTGQTKWTVDVGQCQARPPPSTPAPSGRPGDPPPPPPPGPQPVPCWLGTSSLISASGTVYFGATNGILYAIDPAGAEVWRLTTPPCQGVTNCDLWY